MVTIQQLSGEAQPNRIQDVEVDVLSTDPLVGVLLLQTDFGDLRLAINRTVGRMIRDEINTFLNK